MRSEREAFRDEWQEHVRLKNAHEAAIAREDRQLMLHNARGIVQHDIHERGRAGKTDAARLNQYVQEQRQAWERHGQWLHHVHNNEGVRRQRAQVLSARGKTYERMRRESERIERERAAELSAHLLANRQRAERMRRENVLGVRSTSAAELRMRRGVYSTMRDECVSREEMCRAQKHDGLRSARMSHDAVDRVASRDCVAECNDAERRRKAHAAALMRGEIAALRRARMRTDVAEVHRKRAMHDAVREAALDGPSGGSVTHLLSQQLSLGYDSA